MEPTGGSAQSDTGAENPWILGAVYHYSAASAILHYPFHPFFLLQCSILYRTIQTSVESFLCHTELRVTPSDHRCAAIWLELIRRAQGRSPPGFAGLWTAGITPGESQK